MQHIDQLQHPPTIKGEHGLAWELDRDKLRAGVGSRTGVNVTDDNDAHVCWWIVFAPWAHMAWAYYSIVAIHLRPLRNMPPAKIALPGATHELHVDAMDPDKVPNLVDPAPCWLHPSNFVGQWIVRERPNPVDLDRGAKLKVRMTVEEILAGVLSPDTDFIREWVKRFSDSNLRK